MWKICLCKCVFSSAYRQDDCKCSVNVLLWSSAIGWNDNDIKVAYFMLHVQAFDVRKTFASSQNICQPFHSAWMLKALKAHLFGSPYLGNDFVVFGRVMDREHKWLFSLVLFQWWKLSHGDEGKYSISFLASNWYQQLVNYSCSLVLFPGEWGVPSIEGKPRSSSITVRHCQIASHVPHQQSTITGITSQGTWGFYQASRTVSRDQKESPDVVNTSKLNWELHLEQEYQRWVGAFRSPIWNDLHLGTKSCHWVFEQKFNSLNNNLSAKECHHLNKVQRCGRFPLQIQFPGNGKIWCLSQ